MAADKTQATNRYSGRNVVQLINPVNAVEKLISMYGLESFIRPYLTDAKAELLVRAEKLLDTSTNLVNDLLSEIQSGQLLASIPGVRSHASKIINSKSKQLKDAKAKLKDDKILYSKANLAQTSTNPKYVEEVAKDVAKSGGYKDYASTPNRPLDLIKAAVDKKQTGVTTLRKDI